MGAAGKNEKGRKKENAARTVARNRFPLRRPSDKKKRRTGVEVHPSNAEKEKKALSKTSRKKKTQLPAPLLTSSQERERA